jgi:hypothetical protein
VLQGGKDVKIMKSKDERAVSGSARKDWAQYLIGQAEHYKETSIESASKCCKPVWSSLEHMATRREDFDRGLDNGMTLKETRRTLS